MKQKLDKLVEKLYSKPSKYFNINKTLKELSPEFFKLPIQEKEQEVIKKHFCRVLEEDMEGEMCPICYSDYKATDNLIKIPKCNHEFHFDCLATWTKNHIVCPICRGNIRLAMIQNFQGEFKLPFDLEDKPDQNGIFGNNQQENVSQTSEQNVEVVPPVELSDMQTQSNLRQGLV